MKTMHISWWWGRKDESTGRPILLARSAYIIGQGLRFTFRVVEKYHFYLVSLYKAIRVYFNAYTVHPAVNSFIMILAKQRFSKPSNRAMFFEHPITPQKITLRPTETIFLNISTQPPMCFARTIHTSSLQLRWELIKENKKVRKREWKYVLDQKCHQ